MVGTIGPEMMAALANEKPWQPQQSLSSAPPSLPTWPNPASSPPMTIVPMLAGFGESADDQKL
jgi:hypothetical protein